MKYAILGASSFYGSHFVELLKGKKEEVISLSRNLSRPEFDILGDFELPECDFVVNFISESSGWDPEGSIRTNLLASARLIEKTPKDSIFIHISTPEVHGSNTHWIRERRDYLPSTPYAVSRAAFDMLLYTYFRSKHFPVILTRTANIYGPGQQAFRLIPKAFSTILSGEKFQIHGNGKSIRSFIHVTDACEGLYTLSKKGTLGETYHISTTQSYQIVEVVRRICKILGRNFNEATEFAKERIGKDHAYLLDSNKLRGLGWKDHITLDEGLKDYADYLSKHETRGRIPEDPRKTLQITL